MYTNMASLRNYGILKYVITNANRNAVIATQGQCIRHKHYNPKYKWHRYMKTIKVELPDFHQKELDPDNMTREEMRSKLKEKGVLPPRHWTERPLFISSTGGVFEPYVPPEGDGKVSVISKAGAKQKFELVEKKGKSMLAVRKIRSFDEDFDTNDFVKQAQEVYIKAHEVLTRQDPEELNFYVSERAIPEMLSNVKRKTLRWQFIKNLEDPRVVHARTTDVVTKTNIFAQITVRFHTQQMLAIYDRFGRLMYGSEILAKDALEYVVFEKHLSNVYGRWRIHDKIIPDWMPPPEPTPCTYRADIIPPVPEESDTATTEVVPEQSADNTNTPAVAS